MNNVQHNINKMIESLSQSFKATVFKNKFPVAVFEILDTHFVATEVKWKSYKESTIIMFLDIIHRLVFI
jgi:hypothetical protein